MEPSLRRNARSDSVPHTAARFLVGWCLAVSAALVACTAVVPPANVVGPEGGVVFAANGAAVGVPAGLLSAPLTIDLALAEAPAVPLPSDVTGLGDAMVVRASREVHHRGLWGGFIVGLPVPPGVPTDDLGVAVLVADDGDHHHEDHWAVRWGVHYEPRGLLLAAFPSLDPDGRVVRLVRGDFLASPAAIEPAALAPNSGDVPAWPSGFHVVERDPPPAAGTNAAAFFTSALDGALAIFRDAGYLPFALETTGGDLWLEPPTFAAAPENLRFLAYTRAYFVDPTGSQPDQRCELSDGMVASYQFTEHELMLCAPSDPARYVDLASVDALTRNAYHELFHAVQKAYFRDKHANAQIKYFKEGTASLAEMLVAGLTARPTPDYGPRPVEPSLTDATGYLPYGAQDFWLRVAQRHGLTFPGLTLPFLQAGDATPAVVDAVLRAAPFSSSLAHEYRLWVQHQAYDASACELRDTNGDGQPDTVSNLIDLGSFTAADGADLTFPPATAITVPALSAAVYRARVTNDRGEPVRFRVRVDDDLAFDADPVSSRVLVVHEEAFACTLTPGAQFVPDPPGSGATATEIEVQPLNTSTIYLVVANDRLAAAATGSVELTAEPAGTRWTGTVTVVDDWSQERVLTTYEEQWIRQLSVTASVDVDLPPGQVVTLPLASVTGSGTAELRSVTHTLQDIPIDGVWCRYLLVQTTEESYEGSAAQMANLRMSLQSDGSYALTPSSTTAVVARVDDMAGGYGIETVYVPQPNDDGVTCGERAPATLEGSNTWFVLTQGAQLPPVAGTLVGGRIEGSAVRSIDTSDPGTGTTGLRTITVTWSLTRR